ncbi:MAG TPA: hypothetical protein VGI78_10860 [Acetobacteraceae bacterium]
MTWEILMRVAARIQSSHRADAVLLRLCASEVQHLERLADELVAEGIVQERKVAPLRKSRLRERA